MRSKRRPAISPAPPVFELSAQHRDPDSKLVAAVERIGQAMEGLLRRAARAEGLTPLQARILIHVAGQAAGNRNAGEIARSLGVTRPTVSDALAALSSKGLLAGTASRGDARVRQLVATSAGRRMAARLARWADPARAAMQRVGPQARGEVLSFLMSWMVELVHARIVTVARMCITCRHFVSNAHPGKHAPHHCGLLDVPLAERELRVDCPEHAAQRAGGERR